MTIEVAFLFILLPTTGKQTTFNNIIYRKLLYYFILALAQIPAIPTFNEDYVVQCFNDVTSCNANSNVMMITAGQCCHSTGGSSRHVRVVFPGNQVFCGSCFGEFIIIITIIQKVQAIGKIL